MSDNQSAAKAAHRSFEYFELDGAKFRRGLDRPSRGVEDVLFGNKWEPYTGKDRIKPTLFGTRIEDPLATAEPGDQNGEYLYYEHEGAKFRRRPTTNYTSVDDVLFGSNWEPYTGDTLKPALFGTRIENPLAKAEPGAGAK